MDVIRALLATLRKMFAGDLLLSAGALVGVAIVAALARAGVVPPMWSPILLAAIVIFVLALAVGASARKEFNGRSRR